MTEPTLEEIEEALLEGDRAYQPGSARAALSHRAFRRVFLGGFASNIGTWMQNVVLSAYAYELTGSATFVGIIIFAQLGPLLLVTPIGGLLADALDRRRLLIAAQIESMLGSILLVIVAWGDDPYRWTLVAVVFAVGVGQAVSSPTWSAMVPSLVGRRDLPGAISLNSTQMNGSRVIGPAIGGVLFAAIGPASVFALNAVTYLFVIGALLRTDLSGGPPPNGLRGQGLRHLAGGLSVARRDPLVRRCLLLLFTFSLVSLPFVGQMPTIAAESYGFDVRSLAYGLLYASFGLGAMLGSVALGTVWAGRSKSATVRVALVAFAALLTPFALLREPALAYPLAFAVGFAYFLFITSLSTVVQHPLEDAVRGRVMALWIMGFGGTVPIGNLIAGPVIEATSVGLVLLVGAAWALGLSFFADLGRLGSEI